MLKSLKIMLWGEKVWATIVECRDVIGLKEIPHTLVTVQNERRWIRGHLGKPGEQIMVNTKELNYY